MPWLVSGGDVVEGHRSCEHPPIHALRQIKLGSQSLGPSQQVPGVPQAVVDVALVAASEPLRDGTQDLLGCRMGRFDLGDNLRLLHHFGRRRRASCDGLRGLAVQSGRFPQHLVERRVGLLGDGNQGPDVVLESAAGDGDVVVCGHPIDHGHHLFAQQLEQLLALDSRDAAPQGRETDRIAFMPRFCLRCITCTHSSSSASFASFPRRLAV